jgi:GLPGLI family protein
MAHRNNKLIDMYLKIVFLFVTIIISLSVFSQSGDETRYITKGKIEYERKTNQHSFLDENNPWDDMVKKNLPKFVTYYFDLSFDNNRSVYKPGREPEVQQNKYWGVYDGDNIISTKLDSNKSVTQKNIFGDMYLITDSVRKIEWKIGSEIRDIAGFNCRKAVGKVMDSIIVIAFYTEEILCTGGPESFTGLPGMILGIAIPRMHTTWYATKLELTDVKENDLANPKKGKKIAGYEFRNQLTTILSRWGDQYTSLKWQLML